MKTKLTGMLIIGLILHSILSTAQTDTIDYFGETLPGKSLTKFAPGIISIPGTGAFGDYLTFSPSGDEMYQFTYQQGLKYSSKVDGVWLTLRDTIVYDNYKPMFAPYENLIYWSYHEDDITILKYSVKVDGIWSDTINTHIEKPNFVSATLDSTMYFVRYEDNGDINMYSSKFNGEYHESPIPLPYPINDNNSVFRPNDPYVSPDGSYIILYNDGGSMNGNGRPFITFKLDDNHWTLPRILLQNSGTVKAHALVTISPDSDYLFVMGTLNYSEMDQYWISAQIIDDIRNSNFPPYIKHRIPDQFDSVGNQYFYTIPDSIFFDDDGCETLTITATLSNGSDLPDSLTFDESTNSIIGKMVQAGRYTIKVTATDTAGAQVSDYFNLTMRVIR